MGALGYGKRTVVVKDIVGPFQLIAAVPKNIDGSTEWVKINKNVNELNLRLQ